MSFQGVKGHLYSAVHARPNRLELRGPDRVLFLDHANDQDCGMFVGEDGRSILTSRRSSSQAPTRNDDPLPVVQMNYRGGRVWEKSLNPAGAITSGVLEAVAPRCFW